MDSNKRNLTEQGSFVKKTDTIKDKLFSKVIKCGECGRNYNRKESNHKDKNKRYTPKPKARVCIFVYMFKNLYSALATPPSAPGQDT